MNKAVMKSFAVRARLWLHRGVRQRAAQWQITADCLPDEGSVDGDGRLLIEQIRGKGFEWVMEEAACCWFIRFIALRYMEVNGFLPSGTDMLTDERRASEPAALIKTPDGQPEDGNTGSLYRSVLITQCRRLDHLLGELPYWVALLLPEGPVCPDSILPEMIRELPAEALTEVESVGWLYQFYQSGKHGQVIDPLHGRSIAREDIPVATQLFTTRWVVQYILDNSLGRYWLERHPESTLAQKLTYLATPGDGTVERVAQPIAPEALKLLDPCVGAGHFLSYAFDLLMEIYRECGRPDQEAAASILEHNLYGLDIDERVTGLARFCVLMKAVRYDRRLLKGKPVLHICAMADSQPVTEEFALNFARGNDAIYRDVQALRRAFDNAGEYGSMLSAPEVDHAALYERLGTLDRTDPQCQRLHRLVEQAELLSKQYAVVATNPPYLNKYSPNLKDYLNRHFAPYRGDLFSVFMFRNFAFCAEGGYCGFMTPLVWMFLKSYEPLRTFILSQKAITTLIQFEYSAYEEATVPVCAFVLKNAPQKRRALCFRLSAFPGGMEVQRQKVLQALEDRACGYFYEADPSRFGRLPTRPIAYWLSQRFLSAFENETLGSVAAPRQGLATGCNELFVRRWYEVEKDRICRNADSRTAAERSGKKWFPYNKGGEFRKWYGNDEYLVNWEKDGEQIRNFKNEAGQLRSRPQNMQYYFRPSISWSLISSGAVAFRYKPPGQIFDVAGMSLFADEKLLYLLGLCNSPVVLEALAVLAPTINFQAGDIANLPVVVDGAQLEKVERIVQENIHISRADWDAFEVSQDFKKHPLI